MFLIMSLNLNIINIINLIYTAIKKKKEFLNKMDTQTINLEITHLKDDCYAFVYYTDM